MNEFNEQSSDKMDSQTRLLITSVILADSAADAVLP